jgi:periplasmic protein TonB
VKVGRRLFDDLVLSASGTAKSQCVRALPLSLGIHALVVAVLTTWSLTAVRATPSPGTLVFRAEPRPAGGVPRAIMKGGGARPPRLRPPRPTAIVDPGLPVVTDAPAAISETETSAGAFNDSPICLSGCSPGDPGGGDDAGLPGPGDDGQGRGPAVRVGGDIREPRRIRGGAPIYPEIARRARIQGKVVLECVIDTDGRVTDLRVVSGNPLLADAAADAVRRWIYSPTRLNGQPIRVILNVTVTFGLG